MRPLIRRASAFAPSAFAVCLFLLALARTLPAALLEYGPWKASLDGCSGWLERGEARIFERVDFYLADSKWKNLFPGGDEEWLPETNRDRLTLRTEGPLGRYAFRTGWEPNGFRLEWEYALPARPDLQNGVIDLFLAKPLFMGVDAVLDGKTTLRLDPTNRIGQVPLSQLAVSNALGRWTFRLGSRAGGKWYLRSSCEVAWRSPSQKVFDLIYYAPEGLGAKAISDSASVEAVLEPASPTPSGATPSLRASLLPVDWSRLVPFDLRFLLDASAAPALFADGDAVCFIGDSITHRGKWHHYLADFYLTRYPERTIRFENRGIGGDSVPNVLRRFSRDIAPAHPTVAVVMLGMNDSEYGPPYAATTPPEALARYREGLVLAFRTNLSALWGLMEAAWKASSPGGARVTLVGPSPYDENPALPSRALVGKNGTLERMSAEVRQCALSNRASFIDLHAPLQSLLRFEQDKTPAYTLTPDRVHPNDAGSLVLAAAFLLSQKVEGTVSLVEIDAARGRVTRLERCEVAALAVDAAGLTFRMSARSLPFPIEPSARQALRVLPFQEALGRERLAVGGLPAGRHRLSIDGLGIATLTAQEWGAGVDLSALDTPQARQARAAVDLLKPAREAEGKRRDAMLVEGLMLRAGVDPDDLPAADKYLATSETRARYAAYVPVYLQQRTNGGAWRRAIETSWEAARAAARPVARNYALVPVP
ncbi:MAG: SGNH/GDSL hydrolase family protein [Spirochaetes bacterium]|nr:SGNH/GDSL hydrolase family protein [Spirochaetota bacterium]